MKCLARRNNDRLIITIAGNFHGDSLVDYCTVLQQHNLAELAEITIDLTRADYLSLKGIGLIATTVFESRRQGTRCTLLNPRPELAETVAAADCQTSVISTDAEQTAVIFYK